MPILLRLLLTCLLAAVVAGCAQAPPTAGPTPGPGVSALTPGLLLQPAAFEQLPGWDADAFAGVWTAWQRQCRHPLPQLRQPCRAAASIDVADISAQRHYFRQWFRPWQALRADGGDTGLVTGYYEPLLDGALTRGWPYLVPLYAPPPARLAGLSRAQLDADPQAQRLLQRHAVAWVRDPVDALFMQIQGSGQIRLGDGRVLRLSYAGDNGWPYQSVGRWLLAHGELHGSASMQAIKAWARNHPQRVQPMLEADPRVVYFRASAVADARGPNGALGVPLTAGRSVAVDRTQLHLGLPLWLDTVSGGRPLQRLVFAQDVGSAIRGPLRADYFFGSGDAAGASAGHMYASGRFWVLLPR